jgi:SAM-dependent methyltransferase
MRREEAELMADWIRSLALPAGAVCLNIGSSTGAFRTSEQPHIDSLLIRPIEQSGLRVVHCDMKAADGVDEVGDLLDPAFRASLRRYEADLMICSNLLEHLTDPQGFALACGELVRPGGYGLFTVPLSYPYHPDPIDTGLRLKAPELAALLPGWDTVKAEEIVAGSYVGDLRASGEGVKRLANQIVRTALPFYRPRQWKGIAHRLLWLFRPYRQSMVLLRKPAAAASG